MPSLFGSIARGYLWIILILAVLAPVVVLSSFRSSLRQNAVNDLTRSAWALTPAVGMLLEDSDFTALDSILVATASEMGARITVVSRSGIVLADTEKDPGEMENHRTRNEVIAAFNGVPGVSSRRSATLGREMLYTAVPLYSGDSITAVVRTSLFFETLSTDMTSVISKMMVIILVAAAIAVLSGWIISGKISRPIGDLAEVADRVSRGQLEARAAPGYTSEQNRLAVSINETLARNEKLIGELSESNGRNRAILQSMYEGVAVVSAEGGLMMMNDSFMGLFKIEDPGGEPPPEVKDILHPGPMPDSRGRMEYQGKVISWTSAEVENSGDRVFSFRDITREVKLAEIKRDFAVNVSHELRTPLTAIKGYAETLKEDAGGDSDRYIDVILRNTDRLIALVKDIQILSEVETGGCALSIEPVPIDLLRETVMPLFEPRAREKGLTLGFIQDKPGLTALADRYRVEQILVNLIDNALKYTDSGGVEVRVSSRGSNIVFAVSDTGRGIPGEHQERIFERFFVVDRSRSRTMGGTGLGLSISKHIVEAHGGTISVSSTPGQGSIFLFTLPGID